MGLWSLPAPSEGVLTLLVVNTALSISLLKAVLRSLLHAIGLHRYSPDSGVHHLGSTIAASPIYQYHLPLDALPASPSSADRFRSEVKPVRFGKKLSNVDCRVCLARLEPDSMVNPLPCGHLFHTSCLDKWLDYHHVTCPLCRTQLLPPPAAT